MVDREGKVDESHPEWERIDTFLLLQFEVKMARFNIETYGALFRCFI